MYFRTLHTSVLLYIPTKTSSTTQDHRCCIPCSHARSLADTVKFPHKKVPHHDDSFAKSIVVRIDGEVGAEIQFQITDYANSSDVDDANSIDISGDGSSTTRYVTTLLGAGEYIYFPTMRQMSFSANASAELI